LFKLNDRMSFSSPISKYSAAVGYLEEAMALLSEAPAALSDTNCEVVATAAVPDGTIFLLPLLDTALALLPPCTQLLTYGQLILLLKGKHRKTETEYDLVCDIVGGAQLAEAQLAEGQTGITFRKVVSVLVPSAWLLQEAKTAGLIKTPAAQGAHTGNATVADNPLLARGRDL
jgi:hypothetical protein